MKALKLMAVGIIVGMVAMSGVFDEAGQAQASRAAFATK